MKSESVSEPDWWSDRRRAYNLALVVAGVGVFLIYSWVLANRCEPAPDVEITLFTTAVQAFGYLVAMAVANLFYGLGSWSEARLRPRNIAAYRKWAWGVGCTFSVALPFTIPVVVAISRCRPL